MELANKKVVVTGGVRGLGRAMVDRFLARQAEVAVFDLDSQGLGALTAAHPSIHAQICDITDPQQVEAAVQLYRERSKAPDVVVNNAGILHSEPLVRLGSGGIEKHELETWSKVLAADLSSVFYVTRCFVEIMIRSRTRGVIVNVSSVSASGNPGQSAYSAAKAGVNALTATWAKELAPLGIRVVGIAPGYTETDSTRSALNESVLQGIIKRVPVGRLGRPEEIAAGVLAIIENDFFDGKVFELDGGLVV